jgi:hypothetical protein
MASLIEELQRDALNSNIQVGNLLRKAKTIAVKLDLPDFEKWVENELNGYPSGDVPDYRIIIGQVKAHNQFHGWLPVIFPDDKIEQAVSKQRISDSVAELESLIANSGKRGLMISLTSELKKLLMEFFRFNGDFTIVVSASTIEGVLDAVRNALLEWALKLEKSGIRGEGVSFSSDERMKAHDPQVIYNIGSIQTLTGNIGSGSGNFTVEGNIINADSRAAIEALIGLIRSNEAQLGLALPSAQELNQILEDLQREIKHRKPSASRVREFLTSIRNIAEGAVGSLAAQGILYELSKLMR